MATLNTQNLTETLDLLGHSNRRYVLQYLQTESGAVRVETLATAVAASRRGSLDAVSEQTVEDTQIALHHVHLPKLAHYGIVTYDTEAETVELNDTDDVDRLFEAATATGFEQPVRDSYSNN